jgi:hypothetical protein
MKNNEPDIQDNIEDNIGESDFYYMITFFIEITIFYFMYD